MFAELATAALMGNHKYLGQLFSELFLGNDQLLIAVVNACLIKR